jgi:hypothetical protein
MSTAPQSRTLKKTIEYHGRPCLLTAEVSLDEDGILSITGSIFGPGVDAGGCIHDEIGEHFPEVRSLLRWHLCSLETGPLHYIENTTYLAGDRDCWGARGRKDRQLDLARRAAVWPEATDGELTADGLADRLTRRLPALLAEFRREVAAFGFAV